MPSTIELKILRQDGPEQAAYWEEFSLPWQPGMNIISCLMEIQVKPVNKQGKTVNPVIWESNCLEEVCGACSMVINGLPRQACAALVDKLKSPIEIRPLSKFKVIRDLAVDRAPMFAALGKVKAWVPIDGTYNLGVGPKESQEDAEKRYNYSRCMTCGCCMEACPQYNQGSPFIGPAPLAQAHLFNLQPTGEMNKAERLHAMMDQGGVIDCGKAQNCAKVCPKEIPLTDAIAELGRETTIQWFKDLFARTK